MLNKENCTALGSEKHPRPKIMLIAASMADGLKYLLDSECWKMFKNRYYMHLGSTQIHPQ